MSRLRDLKKEAQVNLPTSGETYVAEDGTASTVLDDNYDDTYEPPEEEVSEYAKWLGIELPEEKDALLWIALEGLKAPLPKEWKPCKTDSGEVYYFNFKTGDSIWDHPMDEHFKSKVKNERRRLEEEKEKAAQKALEDEEEEKAKRELKAKLDRQTKAEEAERAAEKERKEKADAKEKKEREKEAERLEKQKEKERKEREKDAKKEAEAKAREAEKATTPSASPTAAAQPRMISEQQRKRLDFVKKEMLEKRQTEVEAKVTAHQELVASLSKKSEDELSALRASSQSTEKTLLQADQFKQESKFDDERQQLESEHRRKKNKLEDEADALRRKISTCAEVAAQRQEQEEEDARAGGKKNLIKKVQDLEEEISEIRDRHRKAQRQKIESEKERMEVDVKNAKERGAVEAKQQFEAQMTAKRNHHTTRVAELRSNAESEQQRAISEASGGGGATSLPPAELRSKYDNELNELRTGNAAACTAINAEQESSAAQLTAGHEEELRVLRAQLSAGGASAGSPTDLHEEKRQRLGDLKTNLQRDHDAHVQTKTQRRQEQLQEVENQGTKSSADSNVEATLASLKAQLEATLSSKKAQHAEQLRVLEQDITTRESTSLFELEAAEVAAVNSNAGSFDVDAKTRALHTEHEAAVRSLQSEMDSEFSSALAAFADELSAHEHSKKRDIDLNAPAPQSATNEVLSSEFERIKQAKAHKLYTLNREFQERESTVKAEGQYPVPGAEEQFIAGLLKNGTSGSKRAGEWTPLLDELKKE